MLYNTRTIKFHNLYSPNNNNNSILYSLKNESSDLVTLKDNDPNVPL